MRPLPLPRALMVGSVVAATTWVTMLPWRALVQDASSFLEPLVWCGILVVLTGALLRQRLGPWVSGVLQLLVVVCFVLWEVTGSGLPGPETWRAFARATAEAVGSAQDYQAPVPADAPPLTPLFLGAGALGMVAADVLGAGLRRVGAAALVWLALYSVPVGIGEGPGAGVFALAALGFLAVLFLEQGDEVARWGRTVEPGAGARSGAGAQADTDADSDDSEARGFAVRTGAVRSTAARLGLGAVALALLVPPLLPRAGLVFWDGPGPGGDGDVTLANPLVDMRRDLSRGEDVPLLRVRSDGTRPSYVRLSVLTRYLGEEWSSGDREIPSTQTASGELPDPPGLAPDVPRQRTDFVYTATDALRSQWLPTPDLVSRVEADGDWRYDTTTMDFLARDDGLDTAGLEWEATGLEVQYDAARLDAAGPRTGTAALDMTDLPPDVPPVVREIASTVTAGEPTRFRKARALQEWFRTEFDYSLERVESVGNDELVAFLSEDGREGYCEQFAAAMAVMARELDIPARVAVGFLQPDAVGRDLWEFSSHDLHAWPELYFQGSGWVRFEPTPPGRALGVPQYTQAQLPRIDEDPATRPQVPLESLQPRDRAPEDQGPNADDVATADDDAGLPWGPLLGGLLVVLLAGVVAAAPRWLRRRRHERRSSGRRIEDLWSELRDVAVDLRVPWPVGRSPRATAERLVEWFGAPGSTDLERRPRRGRHEAPAAVRALDRLVDAVERDRYARSAGTERWEERVRDLEQCTEALWAGARVGTRRRARWLPASVLARRRRPASQATEVAGGRMLSDGPAERERVS